MDTVHQQLFETIPDILKYLRRAAICKGWYSPKHWDKVKPKPDNFSCQDRKGKT